MKKNKKPLFSEWNKTEKISIAGLAFLLIVAIGLCVYVYGFYLPEKREQAKAERLAAEEEQRAWELSNTPKPTATSSPTSIPEPTATILPEPTEAPQETAVPTIGPTVEPTATTAPEPTATVLPEPTATPAVSVTPTAVPTVTAAPTTTLAPTSVPVITSAPSDKYLTRYQIGENAWCELHEGQIIVIKGTGSTYDYKDSIAHYEAELKADFYDYLDATASANQIIVEEGITRLGAWSCTDHYNASYIQLPSTLKEIGKGAFNYTGNENAEWVGLDLSRIKIEEFSFSNAKGKNLPKFQKEAVAIPTPRPTVTPTPLPPTPTPFPTPNPDKPKMVSSVKAGENAVIEAWDNGYIYVKGTGEVRDFPNASSYEALEKQIGVMGVSTLFNVTHVIVEEGITRLGTNSLFPYNSYNETYTIELPSTLKACGNAFSSVNEGQTFIISGYLNGEKITLTFNEWGSIDWELRQKLEIPAE